MSKQKKRRPQVRMSPARGNAHLNKMDARHWAELNRELEIHVQIAADAAVIAANDVFKMGPARVQEFHDTFRSHYIEICELITESGLDYAAEVLDRRLRPICGELFTEGRVRYNMK